MKKVLFDKALRARHATCRLAAVAAVGWSVPAAAFDLSGWVSAYQGDISAWKVVAKQENGSAEKSVAGTMQSMNAAVTSIIGNMQAKQVRDVVSKFGPMGQSAFPCYETTMSGTTGDTHARLGVATRNASGQIAGWDAGSDVTRKAAQVSLHRNVYCSVSEQKMGICKLNVAGLQSADSDFSMVTHAGTKSTSERGAGYDFVDNIIPQHQVVPCKSPECQAKLIDARSRDAIDSLARLSFISAVEARSQQTTTPKQ
jgi:hypothetical protein